MTPEEWAHWNAHSRYIAAAPWKKKRIAAQKSEHDAGASRSSSRAPSPRRSVR